MLSVSPSLDGKRGALAVAASKRNGQGLLSFPIRITIGPITIEPANTRAPADLKASTSLAGSGAAPVRPPPETARKLLRRFGFGG
jgi:hypothetical protein